MKTLMLTIAAFVAVAASAKTEVFRLERDTETENLAIVGVDGVRRQVALVDPDEYAMLTGNVAKVWAALNSTLDGRQKLHGKQTKTIVDKETASVTTEYADGYRHTEKMVKRTPPKPPAAVPRGKAKAAAERKPANISARHWEMRQRVKAAKDGKPREVTINHNANTGKDTEVK